MTVVGKPFQAWVSKQIDGRNTKLATTTNLMIDVDPEVLQAFRSSSQISSR